MKLRLLLNGRNWDKKKNSHNQIAERNRWAKNSCQPTFTNSCCWWWFEALIRELQKAKRQSFPIIKLHIFFRFTSRRIPWRWLSEIPMKPQRKILLKWANLASNCVMEIGIETRRIFINRGALKCANVWIDWVLWMCAIVLIDSKSWSSVDSVNGPMMFWRNEIWRLLN